MVSADAKLGRSPNKTSLSVNQITSLAYHDIFDYPLSESELIKWEIGAKIPNHKYKKARKIGQYYTMMGKESSINKREIRKRASIGKMMIAENAAKVLGSLPSIKMVGITGALAMMNADKSSDIDLMIICSAGTLWTTRLMVYGFLDLTGVLNIRHGQKSEKDKLCLNMWLDERALEWDKNDRNLYTAHEIAQIVPIVNKEGTYERLLKQNTWVKSFWPNALRIPKSGASYKQGLSPLVLIEPLAREFQLWYMQKKLTREEVSSTKAIFHPRDWGKIVGQKLLK